MYIKKKKFFKKKLSNSDVQPIFKILRDNYIYTDRFSEYMF